MSLNRGVAALGAVAVVGVATLGWSIPLAHHFGQPKPMVAATSGSTWKQFAPVCWNNGDVLTQKQITSCLKDLAKAQAGGKDTPTLEVAQNGTFMINTNEDIAAKGWYAQVPGQQQPVGLFSRTTNQQVGNIPLAAALQASQTGSAPVTVVESDDSGKQIYGVWTFVVKQQGS
ncbi:hypothetical protein [Streptacidiphilus jiangxiensis]|uniref:Uncharacterized protein n=1 Tax=Streptacidiphilus jiangxiensis TaxID=235985 RepID=A0A1H7F382_STRJI|nr:hypothetical protein [Streptacidiphilus jiangxiensis]SEK20583.1 hypothetical protein SAMN05414137_10168 [Streptacidiphilus jiangxiensis]